MKKTIALLLVLALALALFAGCNGGGGGDELRGTWSGTDSNGSSVTLTFDGNGGIKFTGPLADRDPGTYTITGNIVKIKIEGWDSTREYSFVIEGNNLTLTPPEDQYYVGFQLVKK